VSCAVADDTPNVDASVGCAGKLMSIDNAVTAVIAASVAIQRLDPTRHGARILPAIVASCRAEQSSASTFAANTVARDRIPTIR
jgi:hypothetical protein